MSGRISLEKSTSNTAIENRSHKKKNEASFPDQKSGGLVYLDAQRLQREAKCFAEQMRDIMESMIAIYDASRGVREIRANHRSVTGWIAGGARHQPIAFESTLERDFAYLALFESAVSRLHAQPMTLTYLDAGGRNRHYTPDFLVEYGLPEVGTRKAIVEVKFQSDLEENWTRLEPGFRAMRSWCEGNDHEFYIVTEADIRTTRVDNVRAIFPFRYNKNADSQVIDKVFEYIRRTSPVSIDEILSEVSAAADKRAAIQTEIWGLLSIGMIWVDLDDVLGPNSMVHLSPPSAEIEQVSTAEEVMLLAAEGTEPSTFILDLLFASDSLEAILPDLRQKFSRASIVVVSMIDDPEIARRVMTSGADGFICKSLPPHEIVAAVTAVREGEAVLCLETVGRPIPEADEGLTQRQLDVLKLLAQGLSNKEIGYQLNISPYTVRIHVSAVLKSLGATTRAGAVAKAIASGVI